MAVIDHTVKPSGGDFTSLDACLDHIAAIHSSGNSLTITIDGVWTNSDNLACTTTGIITDATTPLVIATTNSAYHNGTANSAYRLIGSVSYGSMFNVYNNFVTIKGIEIINKSNEGAASCLTVPNTLRPNNFFSHLLFHNTLWGIYNDGGATTHNSIFYTISNAAIAVADSAINLTIYNCGTGILRQGYETVYIRNCIVVGNGKDFGVGDGGSWGASNFNLDEDDSAPGANSVTTTQNLLTEFFTSATDFHLRTGADAIGVGTGMGVTFQYDMDNYITQAVARTGLWDIGAYRYVSSGTSTPTVSSYIFTRSLMGFGL